MIEISHINAISIIIPIIDKPDIYIKIENSIRCIRFEYKYYKYLQRNNS
jgi:hypothetical protein